MQVTATIDLQRQTQASLHAVRKHNEHDPHIKHSNVQIFPEETEMNRHYDLLDFDETLEKIYGGMIDERNKKLDEQFRSGKLSFNRYNERKTDIKKWLNNNGKPRQAFTTWVLTLGNVESNLEIMNKLNVGYELRKIKTAEGIIERPFVVRKDRARWSNYWAETYKEFATVINNKDTGFKITAVDVHLDEGGAPHAHFESINCGKTVKGKVSYNLNSAIKQSLEVFGLKTSQNSKANLKSFRASYDPVITTLASQNAKEMMNVDLDLQIYRKKSKHKGLSMEEYKQRQATLTELSKSKQALETNQALLVQLQQRQKQLKEELDKQKKINQARIDKVIAQAQSELDEIERQKVIKQRELNDLSSKFNNFSEVKQRQQAELKELENQKKILDGDIEQFKLRRIKAHMRMTDTLQQKEQVQAEVDELSKTKASLQAELAEVKTLKIDKQRLLQEQQQLQQEVQKLKSDVLTIQKVGRKEALELQQIRQQSSFVKNISDYERKLSEHLRQNPGKKMSSSRVIITNLQSDNGLER